MMRSNNWRREVTRKRKRKRKRKRRRKRKRKRKRKRLSPQKVDGVCVRALVAQHLERLARDK